MINDRFWFGQCGSSAIHSPQFWSPVAKRDVTRGLGEPVPWLSFCLHHAGKSGKPQGWQCSPVQTCSCLFVTPFPLWLRTVTARSTNQFAGETFLRSSQIPSIKSAWSKENLHDHWWRWCQNINHFLWSQWNEGLPELPEGSWCGEELALEVLPGPCNSQCSEIWTPPLLQASALPCTWEL